ncbi:thymidine phosphorylase-like [Gadus chalcogrammus]|uniref:thymidine phosphorylase-like n=1 Tax=Gadus chalcogrammus TaxID=1042646 RepID=UPI0024C2AB06|nr:thymidine phosphorylase-like [Gadus chalcogrammus]
MIRTETTESFPCNNQATMLSIPDLIKKKRDGKALSDEDIQFFLQAVVGNNIQEAQTGAMLMAIFTKGMVATETMALTKAMKLSGEVLSWPEEWAGLVVDKHSTGGVGDKVSLVLAPALAACGLKVPMISGRGLGHTGGTLDKLESIPGFNVRQPLPKLRSILAELGCVMVGQTDSLVPADRILYALRDVTGTVESLPLIAGSIISKKAAESLNSLVLDVKFGRAAFCKDLASAKALGESMVAAGNNLGMNTRAVFTHMSNPIGRCIGNSVEVIESLETLKGNGPSDLMELVSTLGGVLLVMTGKVSSLSEGGKLITKSVTGGAALAKFQAMMVAQGVSNENAQSLCSAQADYHSILRRADHQTELRTHTQGVVMEIDGLVLAEVLHQLGAGRTNAGEPINHSVGAELLVSLGDSVNKGRPWLRIHFESPALTPDQTSRLEGALTLGGSGDKPLRGSLIEEIFPPM